MAIIPDLQRAFDDAVRRAGERSYRVGYTGDGSGHVTVPNKPGWYYVRLGAEGSVTVTQAKNHPKLGVPPDPDLPIRVRRENGVLTIYGDEPLSAGSVPAALGDLADVITGGEQNHHVLQFRSSDSQWINQYLGLYLGPALTAVEASGAISVTGSSHWRVQAGIGTSATITQIATDQAGHRIVVRPVPGHTIILQNGTGNLSLHNGDCQLSSDDHAIELLYIAGPPVRWIELGRSIAAGGGETPYIGGLGIAISGQTIDVDLASPSGLTFVSDKLALNTAIAGNGLTMDINKNLHVNLAATSGLEIVSDALRLRDDIAGSGLDISNKILFVGQGDGILVNANTIDVRLLPDTSSLRFVAGQLAVTVKEGIQLHENAARVDEDYPFLWTADHTFASDIHFSGDRFLRSPGGSDLTIDLGGDLLIPDLPDGEQTFRSTQYNDGIPITGFSLHKNPAGHRQLTINAIKADEIHTRVFVADTVRIDVGEEFWGKSMGILSADFTTPASIGGVVAIEFEDSASFAGALFANGEWLQFRLINIAGGTVAATIWGQVSGYVPLPADVNGKTRQQWTFTLRSGQTGLLIKKGTVGVDFGLVGQGYVHLSTLQSAEGPWIRIGDWTGTTPFEAGSMQERTQIGRLDGIGDSELNPAGWGLYSDNVYLRGLLRTPNALLDSDALSIFVPEGFASAQPGYAITWEDDVDHYLYGGLYGFHRNEGGLTSTFRVLELAVNDHDSYPAQASLSLNARSLFGNDARIEITTSAGGGAYRDSEISLYSGTFLGKAQAYIDSQEIYLRTWIRTDIPGGDVYGEVVSESPLNPAQDMKFDLGTGTRRWRTFYVGDILASSITADVINGGSGGGGSMSGPEWEHIGTGMIIDAHNTADTTITLTNHDATGRADVVIDRHLTVGGLINGVDVDQLKSDFDAHIGNSTIHHQPATALLNGGITVAASQVLSVDSSVVRTTRQVNAGLGLTGGGALSLNVTLDVNPGNGLTISGDTVAISLLAPASGLTLAGGVLALASSAAGAGLSLDANKALNVNLSNGLEFVGDLIAVNLSAASGLEFATGALQLDDAIAGNGLVMDLATRILAVGQGDGLYIDPDAVRVLLHANAGLEFSGGALRMGLPITLDVTSTNLVTTNTHSHNIDSTSDADTNPGKILHSTDPYGGLILGTLSVAGNVDITNNGDLDVANHTLFVDASANSVGIGGIPLGVLQWPDPQFALDVNGPLRASYLVGPHALQVKDVLLLSHFDGKEPYALNTTGEPNSAMGQVGIVPNPTTTPSVFRPGKFFKAMEIAFAATNLLSNPQFDGNSTAGWTDYVFGAATGTRDLLATRVRYSGEYAYRLVKTGGAVTDRWGTQTTCNVTAAQAYNLSIWCNVTAISGGTRTIHLGARGAFTTADVDYNVPSTGMTDGWVRLTVTTTAASTGVGQLIIWIDNANSATVYVDAAQITATVQARPYTLASRNATSLYYAAVPISWTQKTIMAWIFLAEDPTLVSSSNARIAHVYTNASNFYRWLIPGTTGTLRLSNSIGTVVEGTIPIPGNQWVHVAMTIGGGLATLYVNGVQDAQANQGTIPTGVPNVYVGCENTLGGQLDGLIDDFCIVERALPADEIRSIYESNAPIFAETVRYSARFTQNGLGWFDDEGLWMKDANGYAVFGFYGGEAASKSWAGTNLSTGDIFFGRYGTDQGISSWLRFDRDGAGGNPILSLGYNTQPVLEITPSAAKMYGSNLEISNSAGGRVLGVFASASPPGSWAGLSTVAINDVVIGDRDRIGATVSTGSGNVLWWRDSLGEIIIGNTLAAKSNLWVSAQQSKMALRIGGTERITLTNAGELTIKDSNGGAVFTFNASLGAEFSKPLTLATTGGIYQGTGTFASPLIGLKIYSVDIGGGTIIGKLSTYNNTLGGEQVTLDTDGRLKAGGGVVRLDALGISIEAIISSTSNPLHAYTFRDANGVEYGGVYSELFPNITGARTLELKLADETRQAFLQMHALSSTGANISLLSQVGANYATIELDVNPTPILSLRSPGVINLASASEIRMVNDATVTTQLSGGGVAQITQKSATAAIPVLAMSQSDLSEEFFGFVGTVAAGNPIDTAALGTYYGKIRVSVNGTFKYIALYNT